MVTPVISVSGASAVEGNYMYFDVTLSEPSDEEITVGYRTFDGTARVVNDFKAEAGTLIIAAGETTGQIRVQAFQDYTVETDESFGLEIFNAKGGVLSNNEPTIRVLGIVGDDDGSGSDLALFVSDPTLVEGDSGQKTAVFQVTLSEPAGSSIELAYRTVDGSAKAGSDYEAVSGTLTFAPGESVATVEVPVDGDRGLEGTEFFSLVVTPSDAIANGSAKGGGVATILDDDTGSGEPVISIRPTAVKEQNDAAFVLTLSHASDEEITVDYRTLPGTATDYEDYRVENGGTVTFAAGETTAIVTVKTWADYLDETDESVWLELSNARNGVFAGGEKTLKGLGVISDEQGTGSNRALFVSDPTLHEGNGGSKKAVFELTLSEASDTDVTLSYATRDGSAKAGEDYVAKSGTVTFKAGQTVATVEVAVAGDTKDEGDEFFSLVVNPTSAIKNGVAESTGIATILDNDTGSGTLPVASLVASKVLEGNYLAFEVLLSKASDEDVTIAYRTVADTATEGVDYSKGVFTVTIPAGETSAVIQVRTDTDYTDEVDEALSLELYNPVGAVLAGGEKTLREIGIVADNNGTGSNLAFFVSDVRITEGDGGEKTAVFEVDLSRPYASDITVSYTTKDGSAKAGSDYEAESGTLTFKAGQTKATVEVAVKGDQVLEGDETFSLVFNTGAVGAIKNGVAGATGVATILNNDDVNEVIVGTDKVDTLRGLTGNDVLFGKGAADSLYGGDGNDVLVGGAGADKLYGDSGFDVVSYEDAKAGVTASLANRSVNTGDAKGDYYSLVEGLKGSAFADKLTGNGASNELEGGKGADVLTGGGGDDVFVFRAITDSTTSVSGQDVITDFQKGADDIDLHLIDARENVSGNQAFDFIGSDAFSGKSGELRAVKLASDTMIYGDTDGDRKADFAIRLDDAIALSKSDFLL